MKSLLELIAGAAIAVLSVVGAMLVLGGRMDW